jgi:hypothetical protein
MINMNNLEIKDAPLDYHHLLQLSSIGNQNC